MYCSSWQSSSNCSELMKLWDEKPSKNFAEIPPKSSCIQAILSWSTWSPWYGKFLVKLFSVRSAAMMSLVDFLPSSCSSDGSGLGFEIFFGFGSGRVLKYFFGFGSGSGLTWRVRVGFRVFSNQYFSKNWPSLPFFWIFTD